MSTKDVMDYFIRKIQYHETAKMKFNTLFEQFSELNELEKNPDSEDAEPEKKVKRKVNIPSDYPKGSKQIIQKIRFVINELNRSCSEDEIIDRILDLEGVRTKITRKYLKPLIYNAFRRQVLTRFSFHGSAINFYAFNEWKIDERIQEDKFPPVELIADVPFDVRNLNNYSIHK